MLRLGRDIRAKFGIPDAENEGGVGNVRKIHGCTNIQYGNVWGRVGMKGNSMAEFPKLDVAGSTPVARSKIL
jgi:hypothetical protein